MKQRPYCIQPGAKDIANVQVRPNRVAEENTENLQYRCQTLFVTSQKLFLKLLFAEDTQPRRDHAHIPTIHVPTYTSLSHS